MAFCNSCGATLNEGAGFCSKCGASVTGAAAPRPATGGSSAPKMTPPPPAPPVGAAGSSSAVNRVLLVVGIVIVGGIICMALLTAVGLHIARRTRVTQQGDHVKVDTPFGNFEASKDPDQAAKNLGVDIYPGAELQQDGASTAFVAGIRTTNASFNSSDSPDKVCRFYQSKFPNARVSTSDRNRCTIVSDDRGNMITINVESNDEGSRIQISSVLKRASASD